MSDEDMIRRGDALALTRDPFGGETVTSQAIAALPAVTPAAQGGLVLSPGDDLLRLLRLRAEAAESAYDDLSELVSGEPCGECYLPAGETCDICGKVGPSAKAIPPATSPGVTAGAVGEIAVGLSDDIKGLGRFSHHPDPAIDFEIEVECLQSRLFNAKGGFSKPGTKPETIAEVFTGIQRAMDFRVGGDPGAVNAKRILRDLEREAVPVATTPTALDDPKVRKLVEAAQFARNRLEMIADGAWNGDARDFKRLIPGVFSDLDAALRDMEGA